MLTAALVGRMALSLVVVLALLWVAARTMKKGQRRSAKGVEVDVLARQPLAQRASVAVVRLGDQALVLGVTEHRVELLVQQPLATIAPDLVASQQPMTTMTVPLEALGATDQPGRPAAPAQEPAVPQPATRAAQRAQAQQQPQGALAGSALSPQTWGRALDAVRELTVRK